MNKSFICPSCGAQVVFKSAVSVFAVCDFCRSTLMRQDLSLVNMGEMAILQEDPSPLQRGTEGYYKGEHFTVIGRVQRSWEDGSWNEWYLYFDNGESGWLGEAQGFYMVSFESPETKDVPDVGSLQSGAYLSIKDNMMKVDDIKRCRCTFSEGELPFGASKDQEWTCVDLSGPDKAFASIEYSKEGIRVYIGSYEDFDDLKFRNLKTFDGW